jgi:hypothetical protein
VIDLVIANLRAGCPLLGGRVAGAADFAAGLRNYNANMLLPAAYVIPQAQDTTGNQVMTGLIQVIHKSVAVVVEFDARPDRRGQVPAMNYDAMEAALFACLINWKPDPCRMANGKGMAFDGARYLDLDRARLFYQWEFAVDWQITDADGAGLGVVDPNAADLQQIEVDGFKVPVESGDPPAFVIPIPTGEPPYPPPTDGPWP